MKLEIFVPKLQTNRRSKQNYFVYEDGDLIPLKVLRAIFELDGQLLQRIAKEAGILQYQIAKKSQYLSFGDIDIKYFPFFILKLRNFIPELELIDTEAEEFSISLPKNTRILFKRSSQ